MMDDFEKHIKENKHLFEDHKADRIKLWKTIESNLDTPKPKTVKLWRSAWFRVAASVVLLIGLGFFIPVTINDHKQNNVVIQELQDINMHYQKLVSHQINMVKKHPKLSSEDKEAFLSFITELDAEYELLKTELQKNLDNELVLEAIINNYKKRIELIEDLLHKINDPKKTNDDHGYTL